VSLNGGAEVAFTSADTDLEVTGPNGEIVYVDTTAIVAGTSTTIDITSDGTLSIDGGLTSQPITFTSNQVIVDSRDDSVVNIDTTSLTKAATDKLEFPGTSDAFRVLEALRDQLLNVDNLSSGDLQTALGRRLEDVERIETHLLDEVGVQAVALEQLDRLTTRTEDLTLYEEAAYTETVTADLAEATISLQEQLNLQQFTMATVGQLLSQNLLDFLN
jgi:flagellin-like hook-associated protein FlgL